MSKIKLTMESLSEKFVNDTTIEDQDIAKHGFKHNRTYNSWVQFKYQLENMFDKKKEEDSILFEKIGREYLTQKRKVENGIVTKSNVKSVVVQDIEYIEFKKRMKEVEQMLECVRDYYIPFLSFDTNRLKEINNALRF